MPFSKTEQEKFNAIFEKVVEITRVHDKKKFRDAIEKSLETNLGLELKARFIEAFNTAMQKDVLDLSRHKDEIENLINEAFSEKKSVKATLSQFIKNRQQEKEKRKAKEKEQQDTKPLRYLNPDHVQASMTTVFKLLNQLDDNEPRTKRQKYK